MKKIIITIILLLSNFSILNAQTGNIKGGAAYYIEYEQPLNDSISISGIYGFATDLSILKVSILEARIYIYQDTVFSDSFYIAPFMKYATYNYKDKSLALTFSKVGLVGGYKWQWDNFNITLDIGYGYIFGDVATEIDNSSLTSSEKDIFKTIISLDGRFSIGWAF